MFRKRITSFGYAVKGIASAFKSEPHIRIQMLTGLLALLFGVLLNVTIAEWCLIVLCIALVLTAELFNTAIEKTMDHVSPEHHPVVGYIKDISAGAVLITSIGAAVTGLIIFLPKLFCLVRCFNF
jgi:diacylglycerol kinase (ATP)